MQRQNFLSSVIGSTLVGTLTNAIVENLILKPSVPVDRSNSVIVRPEVREAVAEAIVTNPVIINELNAEKPVQSRVLWGNFFAAVGTFLSGFLPILVAIGVISPEEGRSIIHGWGATVSSFGAVVAMGGVLYSVYGRLASGLKPLFSRK